MPKTMISARVAEELDESLDVIAEATKRSKSHLLEEALKDYVERKSWIIASVKQAMDASASDGRFVSEDDMAAWLKSWGTDKAKQLPKLRGQNES